MNINIYFSFNKVSISDLRSMNSSIFEQNSFMDGEASAEEAALALIRFLRCDGICMASRSAMSAA